MGAMATRSPASAMCGHGHYKAHGDVFWSHHTTGSQTQYKLHQQQQTPAKWPEELSVTSTDTNYSSSHPPDASSAPVTVYQLHIFSTVSRRARRWRLFITSSASSRTHHVCQFSTWSELNLGLVLGVTYINLSLKYWTYRSVSSVQQNWSLYLFSFPQIPTTINTRWEQLWILGKNLWILVIVKSNFFSW